MTLVFSLPQDVDHSVMMFRKFHENGEVGATLGISAGKNVPLSSLWKGNGSSQSRSFRHSVGELNHS